MVGWHFGAGGRGGRIKFPQGEPGHCFGAKSKVRELRARWPVALTAEHVRGGGGKGQEGETKQTETFLACQAAEISVCLCGGSAPDLGFPRGTSFFDWAVF